MTTNTGPINQLVINCDAVMFDLDGVLIDSTPCIVRHWQEWADRHGLDIQQIMRAAHGMRTIETMWAVAPHLDVEQEERDFTAFEVIDVNGVVAIDGAGRVLAGLPSGSWAIVTSGGQALARARLKQAGLPVPQLLVTADDVTQGKPHPEPYLVGARRLNVAAERCVVFEDAPAGVVSAKNAGMLVIGITTTHPREVLLENGAEVVIDSWQSLSFQRPAAGWKLGIVLLSVGTKKGLL